MNILKLFKYNLLLFIRDKQNLFLISLFPVIIYIILGESFRFLVPSVMKGENIMVIATEGISPEFKSYLDNNFTVNAHVFNVDENNLTNNVVRQIKKGFQVIEIDENSERINLKLYSVKGYEHLFASLKNKINVSLTTYKAHKVQFFEEKLDVKIPNYALFIFPGIILMSILNTCLFGIGTELANFKEKGILKRLFITPIRIDAFLSSYLLSRFLLIVVQVLLIFLVNKLIFKTGLEGVNIYALSTMLFLTTIMTTLMGFLVFNVSNSFNSAVSFSNYVSMPMLFFSGAFFPVDSSPIFSKLSLIIPITPVVNILRSILIYNDSIQYYINQFFILIVWIVIFSGVALITWRSRNKQLI